MVGHHESSTQAGRRPSKYRKQKQRLIQVPPVFTGPIQSCPNPCASGPCGDIKCPGQIPLMPQPEPHQEVCPPCVKPPVYPHVEACKADPRATFVNANCAKPLVNVSGPCNPSVNANPLANPCGPCNPLMPLGFNFGFGSGMGGMFDLMSQPISIPGEKYGQVPCLEPMPAILKQSVDAIPVTVVDVNTFSE